LLTVCARGAAATAYDSRLLPGKEKTGFFLLCGKQAKFFIACHPSCLRQDGFVISLTAPYIFRASRAFYRAISYWRKATACFSLWQPLIKSNIAKFADFRAARPNVFRLITLQAQARARQSFI
jgi:hypothetical protein